MSLRLPLFIARRYLVSRKSRSVINFISGMSALTMAVPVAALVILLSVFNGLDALLKGMYGKFEAPLQIRAAEGKGFAASAVSDSLLLGTEGVEAVTRVLEDNALFTYRDKQYIGTLRGVDSLYRLVTPVDSLMVWGEYALRFGDFDQAVVGRGMAYTLGIAANIAQPLTVYAPRRERISPLLPVDAYRKKSLYTAGIFALDAETDGQYVLAPLDFVRELFDYPDRVSWIGVKVAPEADADRVQRELQERLGRDFRVLNRYQQQETLYRIMQNEKAAIYLILLLVLVIASFSLIGSLVMMYVDKQRDIFVLRTLGADTALIRRVLVAEGLLISGIGGLAGLVVGVAVTLAQQYFGLVRLSGGSFLVDAYPVKLRGDDLGLVALTVLAVALSVSVLTVRNLVTRKTNRT